MRSGPIGAYFADDLTAVVQHARASAEPTHAHPEGQAGAIAVAVAAALASQLSNGPQALSGELLLRGAEAATPAGSTRDGLGRALALPAETTPIQAARALGNGGQVLSEDTVPFALWCAARHLGHFEEALWTTVSALGDRDTTCAIVASIVALAVGPDGIPSHFREAREPLDSTLDYLERDAIQSRLGRR